ncbi:MAG TPA: hypothetical protein VMW11_06385 [Candidatus Dormibacteraeota bacterium]|nr:hypothetical protein [Candidatus Dormibacteraeota bacterium]
MTIGYSVAPDRALIAAEVFQHLKVPAEPVREGVDYEVVVSDGTVGGTGSSACWIVFSRRRIPLDEGLGLEVGEAAAAGTVAYRDAAEDWKLPVRTGLAGVSGLGTVLLSDDRGAAVGMSVARDGLHVERFGFDLFAEVHALLTDGQPEADAEVPSLDVHVHLLRSRLREHATLVEVPATPWGHDLVVSLSHDIDHASLAEHGFGAHWLSFMKQSTLWMIRSWVGGRTGFGDLLRSLGLALRSSLIVAGVLPDPWRGIDAYRALEKPVGARSTYFFVPFKDRPGIALNGTNGQHRRRAVDYDLSSLAPVVRALVGDGAEVGLHGIDAWHSVEEAVAERERMAALVGQSPDGVRMHYLYRRDDSLQILDRAGFRYDSTVGYGRQTGFRAGTLHPYRPAGAQKLLELPLHLEDGGLLSPAAENSTPDEARDKIRRYLDLAARFGGCLNASWHDNSHGPPRSWGAPYVFLLESARSRGAWVTNLGDVAEWFSRRRELRLRVLRSDEHGVSVDVDLPDGWPERLPGFRLRVHLPLEGCSAADPPYLDFPLQPGVNEIRFEPGNVAAHRS